MSTDTSLDERVMRRLKLRELRILATVAKAGSMGKGAAQLRLSQPAVSKAVAEMEHTLGVPLLDRSGQGVEPTLYGRALLKWAIVMFDDLRQGVREIEFLADPTSGEVRIGSAERMTFGLLPAIIDRLSRQYPALMFTVMMGAGIAERYRDLRDRRVDLTLGGVITPIDDDLHVEVLLRDTPAVVASVDSKWVRRRNIEPIELLNEPWCLSDYDVGVGASVAHGFRALGLQVPRLTVRSNSPHLLFAMVSTGRFLCLASPTTLRLHGKRFGLKALSVEIPFQPVPVGIVTLKNRTVSPVAQLFIDCARKFAKSFAEGR
jgi:DNA-binding transcriptional LysR family regulator